MAQRHRDRRQYFNEQSLTTKKFVIPYISRFKAIGSDMRILEIGCGEGGNMVPFCELGCEVIGVDINEAQLDRGREFYKEIEMSSKPTLIHRDIYQMNSDEIGRFDVIMLRDVIEHIPDQEKFMGHLKQFLNQDGVVFFGFPPWHMPFGGHQQMCKTKLGKMPFMHILPRRVYATYLKIAGESKEVIESRLEIHDTGITIERFTRIVRNNGYAMMDRTLYLFNPNYEAKFGLKPMKQLPLLAHLPYLRNLWTTCCYALIK